jgi:hypothetical protein
MPEESFFEYLRDEHAELLRRFDEFRDAEDPRVRQAIADELTGAVALHLGTAVAALYESTRHTLEGSPQQRIPLRAVIEAEFLQEILERIRALYVDEVEFAACLDVLEHQLRAHVEGVEDDLFPMVDLSGAEGRLHLEWKKRRAQLERDASI